MPAARSICRIRPTSSKRRPNTGPTKPPCSSTSLHPAGHAYTKDNIDALLTVRAESARLRRGDTLADAAEYFCVTEDFLRKAYALYRDMGYDFGAEEKA